MAIFWIYARNSVDNIDNIILLSNICTESRHFLLLVASHQWQGCGCTSSWEGTQLNQLTPTDPRDILYHMSPCSACKAGGRRRKEDRIGVMAFVFPSRGYSQRSPALLGMAELLPSCGKLWMNSLFRFAFPVKLSLPQPTSFLLLFWFFSPSHWCGNKQAVDWDTVARWG